MPEERIRDRENWDRLQELDEAEDVEFTEWELDFLDGLTKLLRSGGELSEAQAAKLGDIWEEKIGS